MKKISALIMSFFVLVSCFLLPTAALSVEDIPVGVSVSYRDWIDGHPFFEESSMCGIFAVTAVHDLSNSNMPIYMTLPGEASNQTGLCKTNTTKIYVSIDLDRDASIKVELLDSSGNSLAETTFTYYLADERTPTVTFTNLTSSKNYRIKITNNSQRQITVFAGARDSLFF